MRPNNLNFCICLYVSPEIIENIFWVRNAKIKINNFNA